MQPPTLGLLKTHYEDNGRADRVALRVVDCPYCMHYPSDSVAESVCLRHCPGITHVLYKSDHGLAGKLMVEVRWADNADPAGTGGQLFSPDD